MPNEKTKYVSLRTMRGVYVSFPIWSLTVYELWSCSVAREQQRQPQHRAASTKPRADAQTACTCFCVTNPNVCSSVCVGVCWAYVVLFLFTHKDTITNTIWHLCYVLITRSHGGHCKLNRNIPFRVHVATPGERLKRSARRPTIRPTHNQNAQTNIRTHAHTNTPRSIQRSRAFAQRASSAREAARKRDMASSDQKYYITFTRKAA